MRNVFVAIPYNRDFLDVYTAIESAGERAASELGMRSRFAARPM